MSERIETIKAMLGKSLGMEYAAAGQVDDALAAFSRSVELDANYLAAHIEAGKCLRAAGKLNEARQTFVATMKLAAARGEDHARDFIRQQLDSLGKE